MPTPVLLIGGIVIVILILIVATISIRSQRASVVEERLGRYTDLTTFAPIEEEGQEKEKRPNALVERLEGALTTRSFGSNMRQQLARADLKLTVTEFLIAHIVSMFVAALATFFIISPGNIVMTIVFGGIGLFLPRFYMSHKQNQRFHNFEQQLPDILGLWVNSLRSGYSVMQALEAISREAP